MNDSMPSGRASKSDELLALAARCEAEEPTPMLNVDIALALGWTRHSVESAYWAAPVGKRRDMPRLIPRFATSLDAAVTLVPEKAWRETNGPRSSVNIPTPVPGFWKTEIDIWQPSFSIHMGWAATEAMSICAAALRARAAIASQESGESLRDPKAVQSSKDSRP